MKQHSSGLLRMAYQHAASSKHCRMLLSWATLLLRLLLSPLLPLLLLCCC